MQRQTRRNILAGSAAFGLSALSTRVVSAAPAAETVTPALIDAAKKEGKLAWYSVMDLPVGEKLAKAFEAKYPGIAVRVERSGAERNFQRVAQETASGVHAVDVINSSDAAHFITWKREGLLAPYLPEEIAKNYPAAYVDADGQYATCRVYLCTIAYNTDLVKAADAPKSFADLLDPKWAGKIVKGHPGYSGTIMTATYQMARDLGWGYFERLAQQRVMQVQSSTDPPKKLALGERAVMADGGDYNVIQLKESGKPVEVVYPAEGAPLIVGPNGIFRTAPNPNAARLFQSFLFSAEAQQLLVDFTGQHSAHRQVTEKPGRPKLKDIKTMKDDAAAVEAQADDIKARYVKIFKV
jgi:iron(III) transport system substrate-binding protein